MKKKIFKFLGLGHFSPYVRKYFEFSNAYSSFILSCVVIFLELWMIVSVFYNQAYSDNKRSIQWVIIHLSCYSLLLLSAVAMFIDSLFVLKKWKEHENISRVIRVTFSVISIVFGIYISFLDYIKGEQFITLVTMTLFVFCFIVWRPVFSIVFLSTSFLIFYFLCDSFLPATYATSVNLFIVWIAVLMSAVNSYHQKILEALKDERLENANKILLKLSISDEITGLANMNYFLSQTLEKLNDKNADFSNMLFLFLNIENFKNYNEKYGFMEGNSFLRNFAECIEKEFSKSIVGYFSNDNFVIFTQEDKIQEKLKILDNIISDAADEIKICLKTGAYKVKSKEVLPIVACDYARYACYSIKKHFDRNYCEYSDEMNKDFHRKQYIINNIDNALSENYIKVYYQPVIDSKKGSLCGFEALARWNDPEFGFLLPGVFINTLEEYRQIYKLDLYVLRQVCKDFVEAKANHHHLLPVSVNFSRLDFEVFDLAKEVESILQEYDIDKKLIHVEITETAITENDTKFQTAIKKFRESGYDLWLDDFGSGYSGLNVLKEYEFDVIKIDMKFLQNFNGNQKARAILKNIVTLANDVGMQTLSEGVETEDARDFLIKIGCNRLQGFLFGKPMPKEEILERTLRGEYKIDV